MSSRSKTGSAVAPKERINISYRPATGNAKEGVELPFKMLVLGDFTQKPCSDILEDRRLISINKRNFDEVVSEFALSIDFEAENKFSKDGSSLTISLNINEMSDFEPDSILSQVDELQEILQLREALKSLKGPLGNSPQMRKKIQALLSDEASRGQLMKEIEYQ